MTILTTWKTIRKKNKKWFLFAGGTKKNGMKYMKKIKGLIQKSFFQFLKNIMNNYFFVL